MKKILFVCWLALLITIVLSAGNPPAWDGPQKYLFPHDLNTFFVTPDQPAVIELDAQNLPDGTVLEYETSDYAGKVFRKGAVKVADKMVQIKEVFPRGLSELNFPALGQRLGVYGFDEFNRIADDYWGVNTVFSSMAYSKPQQPRYRNGIYAKPETIQKHMRLLRRLGIGQLREMDTLWKQIPAPGEINYNADLAQDTQNAAEANGLHILMFYAHFPAWCGAEGTFSKKLPQVLPLKFKEFTPPFRKILALNAAQAIGAQAGNEWDMGQTAAPPDSISLLGHYMRYLINADSLSTPVIGMSFSGFAESCIVRPDYLKSFVENGYFDCIDAFAVNGYSSPEEMRKRLNTLTALMQEFSPGNVPPLWITESGKSWSNGGLRPEIKEDLTSADWIVRKAIDAKAMGAEKYFQFQLHYNPEDYNNNQNFSLLDWSLSPQRTMAAYAAAVRMLSNFHYRGAPQKMISGSEDALLFENGKRRILVLYRSENKPDTPISLDQVPVKAVFQMDGADLRPETKNEYRFAGGILYVELSPDQPFAVSEKTVLADIRNRLAAPRRARPAARPVLLRTEFEKLERMRSGYIMRSNDFELVVHAFNLADEPKEIDLSLQLDGILQDKSTDRSAVIASMQAQEFRWHIACPGKNFTTVSVMDRKGNGTPLAMRFFFPPKLDQPKLTISPKAAEWKPWSSGTLKITDDPSENAMRIDASFQVADRWFFPQYALKLPTQNLKDCYAMTYEARTDKESGDVGYKYFGSFLITEDGTKMPGGRSFGSLDSNWRTFTVFLTENVSDPASIRTVEIGACPQTPDATLWIRNIRFY